MKLASLLVALAALSVLGAGAASARVEFGEPEFPNYLSPPGPATCDWYTSAWKSACPPVILPPAPAAPAPAPRAVGKKRTSKSAR